MMDTISYNVYIRALWATISILSSIDMDEMLRQARTRGSDSDVDLILALRMVKEERHAP